MNFTAEDAMEITMRHQESFNKTKNVIRQMINTEIKAAALRGRTEVIFDIPKNVFGRDTYDIVKMGRAIAQDLKADLYTLAGTVSRLTISWGSDAPSTRGPVSIYVSGGKGKEKEKKKVIKVPVPKKRTH